MKIHWSEIAEADLDDIYDYIARDVPYYAELFVDQLIEAADKLQDHPRMGRKVPEADSRDDVRELIAQGYRIIYVLQGEQLQILTVVHGSRNLAGREYKPWEQD
jgi:addiction module RelE/StbE family toxin